MPSNPELDNPKRKRKQRKKLVLFLVEGKSEVNALETPLSALCDAIDPNIIPLFLMMHDRDRHSDEVNVGGDITSKTGIDADNIEHLIDKLFFAPFFNKYPFYFPRDVSRVVHIVDTDGAFVPDTCIVESPEAGHPVYQDGKITTNSTAGIVERNMRKSSNLVHLSELTTIKVQGKKRPYSVYFFSSNLDHYLYGDANLPKQMKTRKADEFSMQCDMKPSLFYDTLQGDEMFCSCSYAESWQLIQSGTNSLERHSNLGLLLNKLESEFYPD